MTRRDTINSPRVHFTRFGRGSRATNKVISRYPCIDVSVSLHRSEKYHLTMIYSSRRIFAIFESRQTAPCARGGPLLERIVTFFDPVDRSGYNSFSETCTHRRNGSTVLINRSNGARAI